MIQLGTKRARFLGISCVMMTNIAYGLLPAFSFMAFSAGVATETLLFDKFLYGTVLVGLLIVFMKIPMKLQRHQILPVLITCAAYICIATSLYLAYDRISGSLATVISFTYPAMIMAIDIATRKKKLSLTRVASVLFSLGGLVLIVVDGDLNPEPLGICFALMTAVFYVVYVYGLNSKKLEGVDSLTVTGYLLATGAAFNFFRCLISGQPLFTTGMEQLFYMVLLAVVCVFMAVLCFCLGVRWIGPGDAAIINTFEPAFACFFGWLLIGDPMTRNMILGSGLIVIAMLLANWKQGK